jgi:spermidine/putrescine transport system permease protein
MIANMIQIQFGKANNAPLGAALAVSSMIVVGLISVGIYFAGKHFGGKVQ